jgi:hypothetical protein
MQSFILTGLECCIGRSYTFTTRTLFLATPQRSAQHDVSNEDKKASADLARGTVEFARRADMEYDASIREAVRGAWYTHAAGCNEHGGGYREFNELDSWFLCMK